jgi:hypothetical protein
MWPWTRRLRDWAMHDFWPIHRIGPQPQAVHYNYEKAGLTVYDQAIPWNAEAVRVELVARFPASLSRRRSDFHIKLPGHGQLLPESMRRQEPDDSYRVTFRLPLPHGPQSAQFLWKQQRFGQLTIPFVSREEFVQKVQLQMPTLFVRLGTQSVACQTFVSTQCRGLMASGVLSGPTSLVPLLDLGLHVEFRSERGAAVHQVPAQLSSSQLSERQALVAIVPRRIPRRIGTWIATWVLADRPLATQRIRAISQRQFHRSLRVVDTRFVLQSPDGQVRLARQLPTLEELSRAGPCFLVTSQEPGMAGACSFHVRVPAGGPVKNSVVLDQEVLITDGPTIVAPGTFEACHLSQIDAFELQLKGKVLGLLTTRPIPSANFTPEGGFKSTQEFAWSPGADEELHDRLSRLMEDRAQSIDTRR